MKLHSDLLDVFSSTFQIVHVHVYNIFLYVAGETCQISDKRSFWSSPVANNQGTCLLHKL